ncbi:unnamed protein product [Mytilus edulis]|uniref:GH16 domain-containing protein n=2 Tax=Mytilus edulis TaxID=6550 RepID=A0A8S3UNP0_MYTED|nr:unnamed protein product [Mytilus edulis]
MKYGRVEVEAKMPKGDWIFAGIKLLPVSNTYGDWPTSGEIDIVETRGNTNYTDKRGKNRGINSMSSSLHYGPSKQYDGEAKARADKFLTSETFADRFHKFAVEWNEQDIRFEVDGEEILKVHPSERGFWRIGEFNKTYGLTNPWQQTCGGSKMAPFDQEFYLVLDVGVGGYPHFKDEWLNYPYPKPWQDRSDYATRDFWSAKEVWYPTWNQNRDGDGDEETAMKISYVKVWKMKP